MKKIRIILSVFVVCCLIFINYAAVNAADQKKVTNKRIYREHDFYDSFAKMRYKMNKMLDVMSNFFTDELVVELDTPETGMVGDIEDFDYVPQVDVRKKTDYIIITCDLPGMEKDKIDITVKDRILTISGERELKEKSKKQEEASYIYKSIKSYGSFSRSIALPKDVDENNITANYEKGVLSIKIKYKETKDKGYKVKIK